MATIILPPCFEHDLARHAEIRYRDEAGEERTLLSGWMAYRPVVVGRDDRGNFVEVPLDRIESIVLTEGASPWSWSQGGVAVLWRRTPEGDLIRSTSVPRSN